MEIQGREDPSVYQSKEKAFSFSRAFSVFVLNLMPNTSLQPPFLGCWDLRCCLLSQGSMKAVTCLSFIGKERSRALLKKIKLELCLKGSNIRGSHANQG